MSEDRWMKNAERVREICKMMGFRLIGFDPSWSIAEGTVEIPKNPLIVWARDSLGKYMQIPDEFMAMVSLSMGYGWDFEETDEDLKEAIGHLESMAKAMSKTSDRENANNILIINQANSKKGKGRKKREMLNINAELKAMREADVSDYKQRAKSLNSILETRKRLRDWSNDN